MIDRFQEKLKNEQERRANQQETIENRIGSKEEEEEENADPKKMRITQLVSSDGQTVLKYLIITFVLVIIVAVIVLVIYTIRQFLVQKNQRQIDKIQRSLHVTNVSGLSVRSNSQINIEPTGFEDSQQYVMKSKEDDDAIISLPQPVNKRETFSILSKRSSSRFSSSRISSRSSKFNMALKKQAEIETDRKD